MHTYLTLLISTIIFLHFNISSYDNYHFENRYEHLENIEFTSDFKKPTPNTCSITNQKHLEQNNSNQNSTPIQNNQQANNQEKHIVSSQSQNCKHYESVSLSKLILKANSNEGILGSTLIRTEQGYKKAEDLKIGDRIACNNNATRQDEYNQVTHIYKLQIPRHIEITLPDQKIHVAPEHKFYVPSVDKFIYAQELKNSIEFRQLIDKNIQDVTEVNEPLEVIRITVYPNHNYYITNHNILVHNFDPTLVLTIGQAAWEVADKIGYALASGILFYWAWQKNKFNHQRAHSSESRGAVLNEFGYYSKPTPVEIPQEAYEQYRQSQNQEQAKSKKQSENQGAQQPSKDPDDNKNKEDVNKTVESILRNAKSGKETSEHTKQYEKSGGYEDGVKDFEKLNPSNIRDMKGKVGKIGNLKDGRTVNVRVKSKEGRPTLEIFDPNSKNSIKIRYGMK